MQHSLNRARQLHELGIHAVRLEEIRADVGMLQTWP
jgi:hypothetical protein